MPPADSIRKVAAHSRVHTFPPPPQRLPASSVAVRSYCAHQLQENAPIDLPAAHVPCVGHAGPSALQPIRPSPESEHRRAASRSTVADRPAESDCAQDASESASVPQAATGKRSLSFPAKSHNLESQPAGNPVH